MTILVADDELRLRKIVVMFLKKNGHETIEVSTGEQAVEAAQTNAPDVIVMDVNMPGIGGVEACRLMKADSVSAEIPVILLTANITDEERQSGFDAGAAAYMTKPFSPKELLEKIKQVSSR